MRFQTFAFSVLLLTGSAYLPAQIQIGTVKGQVIDASGAVLAGAAVTIGNTVTGYSRKSATNSRGEFVFHNVPFDSYEVRVEMSGFATLVQEITVRSNIPILLDLTLNIAALTERLTVSDSALSLAGDVSSTETRLDHHQIQRTAGTRRIRKLQELIASTAGWLTENNALLHVRGVDDGILYVLDGIPIVDRIDSVSATSLNADMIQSLNVITGNIPAEFGGRSGAVVTVQRRSGIDDSLSGALELGLGNFRAGDLSYSAGGRIASYLGFSLAGYSTRSHRFLDPVDPRNFHNRGGAAGLDLRLDWQPSANDLVLLNTSVAGSNFQVPNDQEQEVAGQYQRQRLRNNGESISWQRVWSPDKVTNLALFRRQYGSKLLGSGRDFPIFAQQERRHTREGLISSFTYSRWGHTLKLGLEKSRVRPHEFFTFAITDADEAKEREVSENALEFTRDKPFSFQDRRKGMQLSWYVQDAFSPVQKLTVTAGLRYDRSTLPTIEDQFSPRIGAGYYISQTRTTLRGSLNRLYMPPQIENLLLANSQKARELSPFAGQGGPGGAPIRAERATAYEAGISQNLGGRFRLDVAQWWRFFKNFGDPNVFFNTTIVFPNSVAEGFARGTDARIDVREWKGLSGFFSYTNARVLQTGPINGGLFLTEEFIEIGPGTRFIPDHDQRNAGAFGVTYNHRRRGVWVFLGGRHESGGPLEVETERLEDLRAAPGSDLVDFKRQRVRPWTILECAVALDLLDENDVRMRLRLDVQNLTNRRFAYNFGNPFEGTHFGHPRLWLAGLELFFD